MCTEHPANTKHAFLKTGLCHLYTHVQANSLRKSVKLKAHVAQQVSLVGHSAGGQMCAMALLHRAKALSNRMKHHGSQSEVMPAEERMPANFIGQFSSRSYAGPSVLPEMLSVETPDGSQGHKK